MTQVRELGTGAGIGYVPEFRWYSVETPAFFREIKLPARVEDMSANQRRRYDQLARAANRHGTHVVASTTRRG